LAVTFDVATQFGRDEADSRTDAHCRQFVPFEEAMNLPTGDSEEHRGGPDVQERLERRPAGSRGFGCMAHVVSMRPGTSRKSTHKEDPSQKERLAYFDEDEATVVRLVLAEDPDFQATARRIAARPAGERMAAAEREAESYAPYKSAGRRVIAELLLYMAEEPWRSRASTAWLFFANLHRKAVWVEDPGVNDVGARRVRERWQSLQEGAQSLALLRCRPLYRMWVRLRGAPIRTWPMGAALAAQALRHLSPRRPSTELVPAPGGEHAPGIRCADRGAAAAPGKPSRQQLDRS
jgi:hypothetical protein